MRESEGEGERGEGGCGRPEGMGECRKCGKGAVGMLSMKKEGSVGGCKGENDANGRKRWGPGRVLWGR